MHNRTVIKGKIYMDGEILPCKYKFNEFKDLTGLVAEKGDHPIICSFFYDDKRRLNRRDIVKIGDNHSSLTEWKYNDDDLTISLKVTTFPNGKTESAAFSYSSIKEYEKSIKCIKNRVKVCLLA